MKVGIIGCVHMQAKNYARHLLAEGIEILGVYDRNTLYAMQFSDLLGIPYLNNLEKIFKLDIDTILICSENALHYDYTLAAAFHKKNVIIEKPMALTIDDAVKMDLACKQNNVKLLVAHPIRFSKTIIDLKKAYDDNLLGEVIAINGTNHGKNPGGWFVQKEMAGGGAIIDHMVHLVDLSHWLFHFEIESIFTIKNSAKKPGVEDNGLIHINFTNGVFMSLDTSWDRPLNYPFWGDVTLELATTKGKVIVDAIGRKDTLYLDNTEFIQHSFEKDMDLEMIQQFIRCIDDNANEPIKSSDAMYTVKIAHLAYESAKKRRIIHQSEFKELLSGKL